MSLMSQLLAYIAVFANVAIFIFDALSIKIFSSFNL